MSIHEVREPITGRYAYSGNLDRLCTCGHKLGDHIAGGFECGTIPDVNKGCQCIKFKPTKGAKR